MLFTSCGICLLMLWCYLFDLASKYSVINTLMHRAKAVCSNSKWLETELKHLQEVLGHCKYPKWALDKVLLQQQNRNNSNRRWQCRDSSQANKTCHIVVPYSQGLCESYKNICSRYGFQEDFKGDNILKNLLMFPKDRDAITKQTKSYIGSNVPGLNVMKNIMENQSELLKRDIKNT